MKTFLPVFCTLLLALATSRADLTITEDLQQEGGPNGGTKDVTVTKKIKGTMARIEVSPQVTTIINTQTGDVVTLMNSQKMAMNIPGAMVKSLTAKMAASAPGGAAGATPAGPPQPTGNKQTINGYETQEYTTTVGNMKISFWLAPNFPDKELVAEQYQKLTSQMGSQFPQYNAFKAVADDVKNIGYPIRTVVESPGLGKTTITLAGINKDPLPDSDFQVPSDYRTMKMPAIQGMQAPASTQ